MEITLWKKEKKIWQYQNNSLTLHPNKKTTMNLTQKTLIELELKNKFDEEVCLSILVSAINHYGITALDMGFHQDMFYDFVEPIMETLLKKMKSLKMLI